MVSNLEELITISREMLSEAKCDHWQRVIELEFERRTKLEAYFERLDMEKLSEQDIEQLREAIESLVRLDNEVSLLGTDAKGEAAQLLGELKSARQAVNAYRDNNSIS